MNGLEEDFIRTTCSGTALIEIAFTGESYLYRALEGIPKHFLKVLGTNIKFRSIGTRCYHSISISPSSACARS